MDARGPHVPRTSYQESLQGFTIHETDPDWVPTLNGAIGLYERAFSKRSSPALKRSQLAQNAFVSRTESVRFQHVRRVRLLFGSWYINPPKRTETREKVSVKLHFS